jgi:hypothetical protein
LNNQHALPEAEPSYGAGMCRYFQLRVIVSGKKLKSHFNFYYLGFSG